jgi:hypothetical protein
MMGSISRRSALGRMAALSAIAVPAAAVPVIASCATTNEDAQFLEWERLADHWWAVAGAKGHTDEETDALADLHARFEDLIFETPSTSPVAARVKAKAMLRYAKGYLPDLAEPMAHVLAALGGRL